MVDVMTTTGNTIDRVAADPANTKFVLLAAFFGGIMSMSFVDGMNKKQRLVAITSGMTMAHYTAPLIAFLFKEGDYVETIGFLIGLFGMSICAAIFRAIQNSDLWGLIYRRLSGGNTP